MLSTLFPPDPTLTVDNVSHIMEKVEPEERQQVLKSALEFDRYLHLPIFEAYKKYSTVLEMEAAAVDIYVNCDPDASWDHLARSLYHHHQMAAVEEVRSYLPPRGKPGCGVHLSVVYINILS